MPTKYSTYSLLDYPNKADVFGNYKGSCPSRAAKKFMSYLSNKTNFTNAKSKKALIFSIINNKTKKEYKYVGTRIKLHEPVIINVNNKQIKFNYKNMVTLYKDYYSNNMKGGSTSQEVTASSLSNLHNNVLEASSGDKQGLGVQTTQCYSLPDSKSLLNCQ